MNAVHVKLDHQKKCKTPSVVIAKSSTLCYRNTSKYCASKKRRHVRPTTSPIEVEMFAEVEPHVKVQQELCPKSRTADFFLNLFIYLLTITLLTEKKDTVHYLHYLRPNTTIFARNGRKRKKKQKERLLTKD